MLSGSPFDNYHSITLLQTVGTTGGLGGAFGLLWGIGHPLPVPEGKLVISAE